VLTEEDKDIAKKVRDRKKEGKRLRARETDEFDSLLEKYKSKVLKKLKKNDTTGGPAFEEVEMSD
jgi:ERCC4-related helicase